MTEGSATISVDPPTGPRLMVIGLGGAGGNAVDNMIRAKLDGVDFLIANTDSQALEQSQCEHRVQLGRGVTRGLGAGSRPDVGRARVGGLGQRFGAVATAPPGCVVTGVDGHPVQPGAECRTTGETICLAEDGDECLLGGVEGGLPVAQHAEADAEDTILVGAHQLVECRGVTCQVALYQLDVLVGPVRHPGKLHLVRDGAAHLDR